MVSRAERETQALGAALEKPGPSRWLRTIARAGLLARAVVYLMLAVLTGLILAQGRPPEQASTTGALAELARQPAGPLLVAVLSAGLACYGAWRLAQSIAGIEPATDDRPPWWKRLGWLAVAVVYFSLCAQAVALLVGAGDSGGPANHPQGVAATVLSWAGGAVWLGLAGAVLAVSAVALGAWGCIHDYWHTLDEHRAPPWVRAASRATGIIGNLTRAVLLALIASYTFIAALDHSPAQERSLDQSLQQVAHSPAGPWWLALVVVGFTAFAGYSVFEALYRRVDGGRRTAGGPTS